MARIRAIKPGFFHNEVLAELDAYTRLFWIGMWPISDRNGVIEYRPKRLKAMVFPYNDEITTQKVINMVADLDDSGFVTIFDARESQWLHHITWADHQKPHHTEKHYGNPLPPETYEKDGYDTVTTPSQDGLKTGRVKGLGLRVKGVSSGDDPLDMETAQEKAVSESVDVAMNAED